MQGRSRLAVTSVALFLSGCGGGGDDDFRGRLLEQPQVVATVPAADLNAMVQAKGLQPLAGTARCDVRVISIHYRTPGVRGEAANASGALLLPAGACAHGKFPLLAYAKGTDVQKPRTLANPNDPETFLLMAFHAAHGYAVAATDYLGYAKSTYSFHPFLHADSEATTVVDAIRAARRAVAMEGESLSGDVLLAGYSQGGHASAAAQREIERNHASEIRLVAAAHMAAPVNLSGALRLATPIVAYQFFIPFALTSWQKIYGNVYTDVHQAFKDPYANGIEDLLPNPTLDYTTLVTSGKLPGGTPQQARDALMQPAFLADVQTHPSSPVLRDAQLNDLLGWSPRAATLMCGASGDPTVPTAVHQDVAMADFASRGVTSVTAEDVDPFVQAAFGPGGKAPTDPASAAYATYYENYHGTYEPPFCHAQARAFFASRLQ